MTTTSLIALNAALGAALVLGLLRLLAHGILSDRTAAAAPVAAVRPLADDELQELAA